MPPHTGKKSSDLPLIKWHKEIIRHLIAILEPVASSRKISPDVLSQIVNLVFNDQTRAPWPGSLLSKAKKENWRQFVEKKAKIFIYAHTPEALSEFVSKVSSQLLRELSATQISSALLNNETARNTQIEHIIRQEFFANSSAQDMISRSIQRYFKEDARARRSQTEIKIHENDPLRDLLGIPRIGRPMLPFEDIKVHMARFLKNASPLKSNSSSVPNFLLTSCFESASIETLIGKEFSKHCQPVGFADRQQKILLINVYSSIAAHEISLSKALLISRLKKAKGFEQLTDIHFRITPKKG